MKVASKPWRHKLEFYKGRNKQWRFRFVHRNGKIIAASTESYSNYTMASRSAFRLGESIQAGQCDVVKL